MIWNCDNFSRWNTKFEKNCKIFNFQFIQNWLQKNIWHIATTINTINKAFKIFHLKIHLYENMFFGQNDPQKENGLNAK